MAFLVAAMAMAATWCDAGIVITSRLSQLEASGQTSIDAFDLSDASTDFGPYDMTIGDAVDAAGGGQTRASAQQQSQVPIALPAFSGTATGSAEAQVAEFDAIAASARSFFSVAFDVVEVSETMSIQGQLTTSFDALARVTLTGAADQVLFEEIVQELTEDPVAFEETLTLAPGSYVLSAEATANGTPSPTASDFDVQFSTTGVVIPLPAPVLGGAVLLLAAAGGYGRRGWRGRRHGRCG